MKAVHCFVSGRVQGVFYRASTCDEAKRLGLSGWVKNLSDGRVEFFAQGPDEQVESLIRWCKIGPPAARVDNVEVKEAEYAPSLDTFKVLY